MKPCSRIWARRVRSGFQNPFGAEQEDRLGMPPELGPGHLFDQFLEGADPARQRDEGIRALEHQALAGVHVGNDDGLLDVVEHPFARFQKIGNDASDIAAIVEDRAGDRPHQADIAAAIDEADAALGKATA